MMTNSESKTMRLTDLVQYQEGSVVSRMLMKRKTGNVTLFAFGIGEGLSEHTAPFDALAYVIDGQAEITVGGEPHTVQAGEAILLPAGIPHALQAIEAFKMLLIMIKEA